MSFDIIYIIFGYFVAMLAVIIALNVLTKGFVFTYIRVKGSKGKKVICMLHSKTDTYFKAGGYSEKEETQGAFIYKNREKVQKLLTEVQKEDLFLAMGVYWIEINDSEDTIVRKGQGVLLQATGEDGKARLYWQTIPGCSPEKADKFIKRAIQLPRINDGWRTLVIVLLCVAILVGGIAAYFGYQAVALEKVNQAAIAALAEKLGSIL
jgi:hypothetical protein